MSTITTRAGKGSPLTNNEVDANFTNLNTDKAELSGAAFTGAITTTSTVDGRDVATDGTKLDGIEASADVTDTANVTAAGALMDSELTSEASVKALNQGVATTDSPSFAGLTSSGEITANGGIALGDGDVATFGDSDDLSIQHLAGTTYLTNTTGSLVLRTDSFRVLNTANSEQILHGDANGAVTAYYDNAVKLATTSTGIDVTGDVNTSGLLKVGTNDTEYANNYIRFKPTGASYIDHSTVGQSINFRLSNASSLDKTAMTLTSAGNVGIGTTSAPSRLTVKSPDNTLATNIAQFDSLNGAAGFKFGYQRIEQIGATTPITFETGGSESMRIDSSGNLLVGKTSTTFGTVGVENRADGRITSTRSGNTNLLLNRLSSDGAIASFYKDGTVVGSIGTISADLEIHSSTAGHVGLRFANGGIFPTDNTGTVTNGAADIGNGSFRFKDLYLSGNISAGTGGANANNYQIKVSAGTTGLSRFIAADTSDAGYIDYEHSSDSWIHRTAGAERMRIDSSGNLLIGKTTTGVAGAGTVIRAGGELFLTRAGDVMNLNRLTSDGDIAVFRKNGTAVGSIGTAAGNLYIVSNDVGLNFAGGGDGIYPATANGAQRDAAIDLGASTHRFKDLYLSGGVTGASIDLTNSAQLITLNRTADGVLVYLKSAGIVRGSISISGATTSYTTSSDYRLKENVVAMSGATERLKQLNPSRFNFIGDTDTAVDGFLAHEVADVVPEAITGTKDAMKDEEYEVTPAVLDDEGNVITEAVMGTRSVPDYQGIDQSKLVPLLVATIQELEARITQLENN